MTIFPHFSPICTVVSLTLASTAFHNEKSRQKRKSLLLPAFSTRFYSGRQAELRTGRQAVGKLFPHRLHKPDVGFCFGPSEHERPQLSVQQLVDVLVVRLNPFLWYTCGYHRRFACFLKLRGVLTEVCTKQSLKNLFKTLGGRGWKVLPSNISRRFG